MKINFSKIMLVSAFVFSVISLISSFLRVDITITNNTYISAVLTLVGICTTFIVGYQIYNAINIKDTMNDYKSSILKYKEDLQEDYDSKIKVLDKKQTQLEIETLKDRMLIIQGKILVIPEDKLIQILAYLSMNLKASLDGCLKYGILEEGANSLWDFLDTSYNDYKICSEKFHESTKNFLIQTPYQGNKVNDVDNDLKLCLKNLIKNLDFNNKCRAIIKQYNPPLEYDFEYCFKMNEESFNIIHNYYVRMQFDK